MWCMSHPALKLGHTDIEPDQEAGRSVEGKRFQVQK